MQTNYYKEKIAKYTLKELAKLKEKIVKDIKVRTKMATHCEAQREFLTRKDFMNPKYALKVIDDIMFAFEYKLRYTDKGWIRYKMIADELIKYNINPDKYVEEERKKIWEATIAIDKKLMKRYTKGMKLFAKHFSQFFMF